MANEKIHTYSDNPWPGKLFTLPDPEGPGWDHAADCKDHYDYTSEHITPEIVLAIITQNEEELKKLTGLPNPKVFHTTEEDTIFIYYSDHGYEGGVGCGSTVMTTAQIQGALKTLHTNKGYSKLAFFLEACESGSVFDTLPSDLNIYAFTSANATEPAWCEHCPPDDVVNGKSMDVCMSMYYDNEYQRLWEAESTTITLGELFQRTHDHVAQYKDQEVSEWGDLTMRDLPMTTFIGDKPIKTRYSTPSTASSVAIEKSEEPLHLAKWAAIRADSNAHGAMEKLRDIVYEKTKREVEVKRLAASVLGEKEMSKKLEEDTYVYKSTCASQMFQDLVAHCHHTLPFPKSTRNLVHAICAEGNVPEVNWDVVCM